MQDILEEFHHVEKSKSKAAVWIVILASGLLLFFLILEVIYYMDTRVSISFIDPVTYIFGFINIILAINIYLLIKRRKAGWVISVLVSSILLAFSFYTVIEHLIKNPLPTIYWRGVAQLSYITANSTTMLTLLYFRNTRQQFGVGHSLFQTVTVIGSGILLIAFFFAS